MNLVEMLIVAGARQVLNASFSCLVTHAPRRCPTCIAALKIVRWAIVVEIVR